MPGRDQSGVEEMSLATLIDGRPLRQGMQGALVSEVQRALAGLGYPLKGTGYFGGATDTAVEDLQRKAGLTVDGEVGIDTAKTIDLALAALKAGAKPTPAAAQELSRPLWLVVSISHIGLKEAPDPADNAELVADIREVAGDYFHDSTPWCAGWVSFCLARAGLKPSQQPLWALSYADGWGIKLAGPAVGAIAVKHRNGGGHVTFVAGRTASGRLACCGGNQNDMVNISGYPEDVFDGFYWPKDVPLPAHVGLSSLPLVNADGAAVKES